MWIDKIWTCYISRDLAGSEQSDDLSSEAETHSLPPDSLAPESLAPDSLLAERFSPDKMPQLTQDQQKALAGMA